MTRISASLSPLLSLYKQRAVAFTGNAVSVHFREFLGCGTDKTGIARRVRISSPRLDRDLTLEEQGRVPADLYPVSYGLAKQFAATRRNLACMEKGLA